MKHALFILLILCGCASQKPAVQSGAPLPVSVARIAGTVVKASMPALTVPVLHHPPPQPDSNTNMVFIEPPEMAQYPRMVQASTDLNNWQDIAGPFYGGFTNQCSIPNTNAFCFFRVRAILP